MDFLPPCNTTRDEKTWKLVDTYSVEVFEKYLVTNMDEMQAERMEKEYLERLEKMTDEEFQTYYEERMG